MEKLATFISQISSKAWKEGIHRSKLEQRERSQEKSGTKFLGGNTDVYAEGCVRNWASKGQQKGWALNSRSLGKRLIK